MNFSTNQTRQLFVAKAYDAGVVTGDVAGTIGIKKGTVDGSMSFLHKGPDSLIRSDLFKATDIISAKSTISTAMARDLKKYEITLDSAVNSGAPVAGQDYIFRVLIKNYIGLSENDQYVKFGAVRATTGMTAATFYKELKASLVLNFSRELSTMFTFTLDDETTPTKITIEEVEQEWMLGKFESLPINFDFQFAPITVGGSEVTWGVSTKVASTTTVGNGKVIADLEYFCMGERGDIYRGVGYPNDIVTTYLIDPTKTYDTLDIHFAYTGGGENPQKSEKTITIVADIEGTSAHEKIDAVITAFNTATGLSVATLGA